MEEINIKAIINGSQVALQSDKGLAQTDVFRIVLSMLSHLLKYSDGLTPDEVVAQVIVEFLNLESTGQLNEKENK